MLRAWCWCGCGFCYFLSAASCFTRQLQDGELKAHFLGIHDLGVESWGYLGLGGRLQQAVEEAAWLVVRVSYTPFPPSPTSLPAHCGQILSQARELQKLRETPLWSWPKGSSRVTGVRGEAAALLRDRVWGENDFCS